MTVFRAIPIGVHGVVEMLAAPLLVVAPFALGFSYLAGAISIALGALWIGLAVSLFGQEGERGGLPLTAHAGFDRVLATITIVLGVALGITGDLAAAIFMVGFGTAHMALTGSTRFSRPLGA